ncbi:MAG: PH domain-containing protein [Patescibacteria group bacterium]
MNDHTASATGETPLLILGNHWMQYAMPILLMMTSWFLYVLCTVLSLALMGWNHIASIAALIAGHAILLFFHHAAFYQIFSLSTSRTFITNKRILGSKQRLWFSDDMMDVPLWKIRSMEVSKKGIVQHIFDYGSIIINRGELPGIHLIPHPNAVHARIVSQLQELQSNFGTASTHTPPPA